MMQASELKGAVPNEMFETLEQRGIKSLTPPQEMALKRGLLNGGSMVVASPTASGKTFIAEMAMINSVIRNRKKAVYVAPMRALVSEKYEELKSAYPFLKIAMSIGDLDSLDPWLSGYDIIFASTEKLDSLIRHGLNWLDDVGCVVIDEVHMLDDASRGPTLEILMTKLRRLCKSAQILALSATIGNAKEIAEWLGAELVESDYRPVRLEKGVTFSGKAYYLDREEELEGASSIPEIRIVQDTLERGKQILVFYGTKRNAEASAERLSQVVSEKLSPTERAKLAELSDDILHALGKPTAQCEKEAKLVAKGVAFHHSGLVNAQRHAIEDAFKSNALKVICATPTLCLPADQDILCFNPGPNPISNIKTGDKVLSKNGSFEQVIIPTKRQFDGNLINVIPYGQFGMKMTPEHRVLSCRRKMHSIHSKTINKKWRTYSAPEWIEAGNLKASDMVLFPRIKEARSLKKLKLPERGPTANQTGVVGTHWTQLLVGALKLDSKTLEAMGLFIAEGSTGRNGVINFDINTKEEDLTKIIVEWFAGIGLKYTVKDQERHRRRVRACSKQIAAKFRELFGTNAHNKHIPSEFMFLPKGSLLHLVRGMWLGDGSLSVKIGGNESRYSTVSKVLAHQLFAILVKLGYMPRISKKKNTGFGNLGLPKDVFVLGISGRQLKKFTNDVLNKKVNFLGNRDYNLGHIDKNYYYMPIRKIETLSYSGTVYNLEVEKESSYVGSFIVHNSLGVNLPAHTVLVRDTSRYSEGMGSEKLSVNEVTQLFGRAGRPKYDKEGRGLLIAKAHAEIMDLYERYINAKLEPISSKLGMQPILRMHVLAFIATRMLKTKEGIHAFLRETLYGYQFANTHELDVILTNVLSELEAWRFIERKGSVYEPTRIGQRVSELYIDPLSAKWLIDTLPKVTDDVGYLFTICNTLEMRPHVKATEEAFELLPGYDLLLEGSVINYEVDEPEKSLGTALALRDWANETPERDIVKSYNTTPGTLFVKLNNADWMLYASTELAKLLHLGVARMLELRVRTKYGVRKELLDLIRLEQVGRVRARLMYNNGIKRVADLRLPGSAEKVQRLFGKEVAKKILEQL
ncbi:MAG: DEAD/DEAH box helicase [Candidatus Micrarchaeota archaeon]|nr:DEAD/DEAH box helicase [Candidatus Micrarchaeota archaeon]